ncbi:MAG: hypothetical protein V8R80_08205 [Eubacterium sp.]
MAKDGGTLREIHLKKSEYPGCQRNVYDKHMNNGGIYFTCLKPENEEKSVWYAMKMSV